MTSQQQPTQSLTASQSDALFDILTHHATYTEIESFKQPSAIKHYGPPFQSPDDVPKVQSVAPILQTLLSKFVLRLPGLRDVAPDFWTLRVKELIEDLSAAELSESYDKGVLGVRKTLATAISALIEYPARAYLGGVEQSERIEGRKYDTHKPEDVLQAWQDCLQELVYGDLVSRLFLKAAETDDLSKHEGVVKGMHEFVVVNIASLMHYTLVLSPEGPTILRMIDGVHKMVPYTIIRQTLKIGNVATMLSGMMRVVLAKASLSSITNWVGITSGADEGMNLLQQIISQVLGWDKRELKKRSDKLEKDRDAPPKAVREELKSWIASSTREEHAECRRLSAAQSESIVAVILSLSSQSSADLSPAQHAKALEYLALQLGVRDRQEIIRVLCQRNPDHLTAAVRAGVDAYTPMIRHVHQAVNLADTVWDAERFITDMLKVAMPPSSSSAKGDQKAPGVEDFVDLLHRHQSSSHKFLHQVAKNGPEVTSWWKDFVLDVMAQFDETKRTDVPANGQARAGLEKAYAKLSPEQQTAVAHELDAWSTYIADLHEASFTRIAAVITRKESTPYGPGAYLARWQHLLDTTPVTPATAKGAVRMGNSKSVKEEGRKGVDGKTEGFTTTQAPTAGGALPDPPSMKTVTNLLGAALSEVLKNG